MSVPFVDLRRQYKSVREEIDRAAMEVLEGGQYILGEQVEAFEAEMADYCGVAHAVGVNSGTDALLIALIGCGIQPGDQVITASHSFFATAEAISLAGAEPVFVDIDEQTMTIDVHQIESRITPETRAIVPVHLYGQPADMDPIMDIAGRRDLVVIEDACQAIGATYKGKKAGASGHAACFSFVPAKNLGGYGDGGMVVTNDERLASKVRTLRNHGSPRKYHHDRIGYNSRLDSLQAAMLRVKLPHLDAWNAIRRDRAQCYNRLLRDTPVILPMEREGTRHVYHLYVIRTIRRDALQKHLKACGIDTIIHYPIPIHRQAAYRRLPAGPLPATERAANEVLSLPMFPEMSEEDVEEVVAQVGAFETRVSV